jgi:hypothetical protein
MHQNMHHAPKAKTMGRNPQRELRGNLFCLCVLSWCREGGSNPHGRKGRRILSPLRLPVPPSRLAFCSAHWSVA